MQELLWEAGRAGTEGGDVGDMSPETAAVKRASALESRRFLDTLVEAEAEARRRLLDGGDGGDSSPGDDESYTAAPVRGLCNSMFVVTSWWVGGCSVFLFMSAFRRRG